MFYLILSAAIIGIWAYSDYRYAEVNNLLLFLPCLLMLVDPERMLYAFIPMIIVLYVIHLKLKDKLPVADVISLPFTFFFMTMMLPLSLTPFPFVILIGFRRSWFELEGSGEKKIRFIPLIFIGYMSALAIHVLSFSLIPL